MIFNAFINYFALISLQLFLNKAILGYITKILKKNGIVRIQNHGIENGMEVWKLHTVDYHGWLHRGQMFCWSVMLETIHR